MAIFWGCLLILNKLFKLKKRGWEIEPGLLLIKTRKFNSIIDKIARKAPNLWRKIWNVGIIVGIIGMFLITGFLTYNFLMLISPSATEFNAILPIIPGITVGGETLLQIIVPIIIIMISHELAHGIAARIDKIKLKSSGFLMFLVTFGAFVEVDEKKMKKKSQLSQMRVFSAGSFSNIMVGFFTFVIFINANIFLSPFYSTRPEGVLVQDVGIGPSMVYLSPGSVILAINGTPIPNVEFLTVYMWHTKPNQTLFILTDKYIFCTKTWVYTFGGPPLPYQIFPSTLNITKKARGALGIGVSDFYPADGPLGFLVSWLSPIFYYSIIKIISWVFILSLGIALFNLLPIPLFDGDKLFVSLVNKLFKNEKQNQNNNDIKKDIGEKNSKQKRNYSKKDIVINIVRGYATFLLLSSIIITIINVIGGTFNLSSLLG